jgi:hypothetical protein
MVIEEQIEVLHGSADAPLPRLSKTAVSSICPFSGFENAKLHVISAVQALRVDALCITRCYVGRTLHVGYGCNVL